METETEGDEKMDIIDLVIGAIGSCMLLVGFLGMAFSRSGKSKYDSVEYFFEQMQKGEYTKSGGVVNGSVWYNVLGSDFNLYIDLWSNESYFCSLSNTEMGEVFHLRYKQGAIIEFNNTGDVINLDNAETVKAYINSFLSDYENDINESKRNQSEINNKMIQKEKIKLTPVKLDKAIISLLQETKDTIKYISNYTELLSIEEAHYFEQLRDTDIATLLETYQHLDKEKQKSEKESLLEGLKLIRVELEITKKRIQNRTTRQFEKRIEVVKQRKRDREIGER